MENGLSNNPQHFKLEKILFLQILLALVNQGIILVQKLYRLLSHVFLMFKQIQWKPYIWRGKPFDGSFHYNTTNTLQFCNPYSQICYSLLTLSEMKKKSNWMCFCVVSFCSSLLVNLFIDLVAGPVFDCYCLFMVKLLLCWLINAWLHQLVVIQYLLVKHGAVRTSFFFSLKYLSHFFPGTFWPLKHFGHLSHSCIKTHHNSVFFFFF